MCAFICIVSEDRQSIIGNEDVIYDGIIFRDLSHLNRSQRNSEEYSLQKFIAEEVILRYRNIYIKLSPEIKDIRAFKWVNYRNKSEKKYSVEARYTSYLDINDFEDKDSFLESNIYINSSNSRRQIIRKVFNNKVITKLSNNISSFIKLFEKNMLSQNIKISNERLNFINQLLTRLLKEKKIKIFNSYFNGERPASSAIFLLDQHRNRAYYLFGANDPDQKNDYTGTAVISEAIMNLTKDIELIDLEGINSPNRGWFKTSFGGNTKLYFHVSVES